MAHGFKKEKTNGEPFLMTRCLVNKNYCVYEHIFPNGKKYIGISCDAEKRWRNGKGYETQPKIARAINKYGWKDDETMRN